MDTEQLKDQYLTKLSPSEEDGVLGACAIQSGIVIENTLKVSPENERKLADLVGKLMSPAKETEVCFIFDDDSSVYATCRKEFTVIVHHSNRANRTKVSETVSETLKDLVEKDAVSTPSVDRNTGETLSSSVGLAELAAPNGKGLNGAGGRTGLNLNESADSSPAETQQPQTKDLMSETNEAPAQAVGGLMKKKEAAVEERENIPWPEFRAHLEGILSKVMGDAQAAQMVKRNMGKYDIDEGINYPIADLSQFGNEILNRVPNKSKKEALLQELDGYLQV